MSSITTRLRAASIFLVLDAVKLPIFFCPLTLWWNWDGESEWTVLRAQKGRARITDLKRMTGTVNQKAVQKKEVRDVR